ncbi:hypothetical protein D3C75_1254170 [compost metagenome]
MQQIIIDERGVQRDHDFLDQADTRMARRSGTINDLRVVLRPVVEQLHRVFLRLLQQQLQ